MAELEAKARGAGESARAEIVSTLDELKQRRDTAQKQLVQLRDASDAAFNDLLDGIEEGWNEVGAAFDRARERFH